jgi:hypothetical protein
MLPWIRLSAYCNHGSRHIDAAMRGAVQIEHNYQIEEVLGAQLGSDCRRVLLRRYVISKKVMSKKV